MTEAQEKQLQGYLESSRVEAITYPFAFGPRNEPCLLITSVAGGGRYTDAITPDGETTTVEQWYPIEVES